ncbi:MAG: hypothetical protein GF331_23735 [Chitinivibrionales bacterium]|nr:hypothetical protein [Chitinivibrionales bacterium]
MDAERFEDFVKFAIGQERAAAELYEKHAGGSVSRSTRKVLTEMAGMERTHEARLRTLLATGMASFPSKGGVRDMHVSDYMLDEELAPDAPIDKVFVFAMKAEQKAYELYARLATLEVDSTVHELFESLAAEEQRHKRDLEEQYESGFMRDN